MLIQQYLYNQMREQFESTPQSHSGYITESNEARKQRMDRKRAIRKNKFQSNLCEHSNEYKQKTSKQQKMQLQKAKNRQAAQRSRDQHKKYVQNLEEQIRQLKLQMSKPKYCLRCSKDIALQTSDSSNNSPIDLEMDNLIPDDHKNQNNQEFQEYYNNDSSFIRVHDFEESPQLKTFMFVAMIILGVFLVGDSYIGTTSNSVQISENARELMELKYETSQLKKKQNNKLLDIDIDIGANLMLTQDNSVGDENNIEDQMFDHMKKADIMNLMQNSFNSDDGQITSIVPLTYDLSPLNQENCLKSLIQQKYIIKTQPKFYEFQGDKHLKEISLNRQNNELDVFQSLSSYEKSQNNILFCTLPKIYRKSQSRKIDNKNFGLFSKIIDIIVSGSQMMQIFGKLDPTDPAGSNLWMNRVVNFNGLYKINAQIKAIVQISDENCVL